MHLVEKGYLKLADPIFSSIENCQGITCNRHKHSLISYKWLRLLNETTLTFPLYFFLLYLNLFSLFLFCYHLLLHVDLSVMLVLLRIYLSEPTNVCDGTICSSNFYPSKPITPSEPSDFPSCLLFGY